jgi:hypothetical protein
MRSLQFDTWPVYWQLRSSLRLASPDASHTNKPNILIQKRNNWQRINLTKIRHVSAANGLITNRFDYHPNEACTVGQLKLADRYAASNNLYFVAVLQFSNSHLITNCRFCNSNRSRFRSPDYAGASCTRDRYLGRVV